MESSGRITALVAVLAFVPALLLPATASAREVDSSIAACLEVWRDHPFGKTPQYKTLDTSIKVFGIGGKTVDAAPTNSPELVLINPSFNVMGVSTIELLNPNGWYCLRTTVSLLGNVNIRAHCKARLAAVSAGAAALGNNGENRSVRDLAVTLIGSVSVERPCD